MSLDRTIYGRAHAFLNRLGCAFNAGRAVAIHGAVALAASVPVLAAASGACGRLGLGQGPVMGVMRAL